MRNFLGAFAAVSPLIAAAPLSLGSRDNADYGSGCTSLSFGDFAWAIEEFKYSASYQFTTPAHQVSGGTVSFNLSNPALPETVTCTAYSTWLTDFFYGNINYNCVAPQGSSTKTSFAFNEPTGELTVNQTWTCTDNEPTFPVTFKGLGAVNLPLDCKEDNYQNPDWQMGETYSSRVITCAPINLNLKPHDKSAIA
ncbi:hypothetical protein GGS21DRAFT_541779 [Xylaria nigripes]|nr:hypothetical protein GGS21DRAFT_541779 [Xylaria nigripes]